MYQKALESPGLISLVKPMKMFHPLTIFSADKNWSIAFPDRCGELANKNAMNCHQHSSRQPLFAIFASFWKSRENLVNKANRIDNRLDATGDFHFRCLQSSPSRSFKVKDDFEF